MGMCYLPFLLHMHFGIKESDDSMKQLLQYIKYDTYKWNICAGLKVIALLLGVHLGYTKFPCFLCEWDSRDKAHHYVKRIWLLSKISAGLLSGELWFCEWRTRWTFPPGHCSNGGQIQREMEPIYVYWLLLDLDAWFSKFDVQSAGEEGPIALELYATFDLWRSRDKRR